MTERKRSRWDNIKDIGRKLLDEIESLFDPGKKRRPIRVPVPVPVRPERRPHQPNPYQ